MLKRAITYFLLICSVVSHSQIENEAAVQEFTRLHDKTVKYQTTNLDSADFFMDSCFQVSKKIESNYYYGKALQLKTRGEFYAGEVDSSIYYGNLSLDILKEYPDSLEYFMAEYNQGNMFLYQEDNIQALVQFKKAANIIDENFEKYVLIDREQVTLNRAYCHASIGIVLMNLEDFHGSLKEFNKSLKLTYKLETWEGQMLRSVVLSNLGSVLYSLNDFEMAESYAVASMEQKKLLGQEGSIGYSFQVLSNAAYGRGKFKLSLKYLDQSDKKFEILNNRLEINRNQFYRAKSLMAMKRSQEALDILENLEEIYLREFMKIDQADFYELYAEAYQSVGDFNRANDYLRITLKLRKELDVKNDKRIVQEFLTFFENEEVQLNDKIQNLKFKQAQEKLKLQIEGENQKKVWIYTLFLVSIICLVLIIMVISNAYRRNKKTNKELSDTIEEKQILFKEVHHRVKNNFQIISSLLNLQHGIEEDERGRKVLNDAQGRIQSMSLVHEMLYRKNEVKRIHFKTYAEELVTSIVKSVTDENVMISHEVNCQNESFDLAVAVPLGLILNEAITNSVKYAFNELQIGKIEIELEELLQGQFQLKIKDNGSGIPDDYLNGRKETLGIELVNILSEQLGGSAEFKNQNGTEITVRFKA